MSEDVMRTIAERQHGVVATWQVTGDGRGARRAESGHWEMLPGSVLRRRGSPRTVEQSVMAAVLGAGDGSIASHATAAALWQLPGFSLEPIEVTRGGRLNSHVRPEVSLHRPWLLLPHHRREVRGVPVTSLPRTIFDLSARLSDERLGRVVNLVANRSPGALVALHEILGELAGRGRPGVRAMRAVLRERPIGSALPMSGLEMRFETILRERGQAPLRRQVDLGGHEWLGRVDYHDDAIGLVVEIDSVLHHTSPMDRARDEERDRRLLTAGFQRVLRIPEEDVWYHPHLVHEAVRDARRDLHHELGAAVAGYRRPLHPVRGEGRVARRPSVSKP
jgi:very-short-patch-repair endonuclease